MNPIDHNWSRMKLNMNQKESGDEWEVLFQSFIRNLVVNTPRRVAGLFPIRNGH